MGVVAAVRHEPDRQEIFRRDTTADGRRELRALRRDPVLGFRAPGTRLTSAREEAAGRDWWGVDLPTEIRQAFALDGEPGDAVDAYRARAEEVGWRVVETTCSFSTRSTRVLLTRQVEGWGATLELYGHLERPPPDRARRGLIVVVTGEAPARRGPETVPPRRSDVHCLRGSDPADPTLAPPARLPASGAEVCGLLRLGEVSRIVPTVRAAQERNDGCWYDTDSGGFGVLPAREPRAFYDDLRWAQDRGDARYVLLHEGTEHGPTGVWVDTRVGPVRVAARLDAGQLVALAELLARRS